MYRRAVEKKIDELADDCLKTLKRELEYGEAGYMHYDGIRDHYKKSLSRVREDVYAQARSDVRSIMHETIPNIALEIAKKAKDDHTIKECFSRVASEWIENNFKEIFAEEISKATQTFIMKNINK